MTRLFQRLTRRHPNVLGILTVLAGVSSILFCAGCFVMTSGSNTAKKSTDTLPPVSTITSPTAGATVVIGPTVNITGTASDAGGGSVAGVSVSVDGGATWNVATGTNAWSYNWTPTSPGPATIKSRAVDASGNQQNPPAEITVTIVAPPQVA